MFKVFSTNMANKNLLKTCLSLLAIFSTLIPNLVFADYVPISCSDLNDPNKTKDWIITIMEEQFGGKTSQTGVSTADTTGTDTFILDCMRITTSPAADAKPDETTGELPKSVSQYGDLKVCGEGQNCQRLQILISKTGTGLFYGYIGLVYRWAAATIGMVCVGMITYYGVRIAAAGDNAGVIDEAKQHIMQSLGGLVLLFLSAVILYTINPNFFVL